MPYKETYLRKLPHIQPLEGTFFVTYRLYGTLPAEVRYQLKEEYLKERDRLQRRSATTDTIDELSRRFFGRYDQYLDSGSSGPVHLTNNSIAQLVVDSLHYWDTNRIELIAYTVMSNHVHVVFTLLNSETKEGRYNSLANLMQSIKSYSGRKANELLSLTGKFWEEESYDRMVRNDAELIRIIRYVLNNPIKAGLCQNWREWQWSYIKPEYDMF